MNVEGIAEVVAVGDLQIGIRKPRGIEAVFVTTCSNLCRGIRRDRQAQNAKQEFLLDPKT